MIYFPSTKMQTPAIAERDQGSLTLYFHEKQTPPTLPYELNRHVSADAWASRVPQILRLTASYNHPRFEAVWILISVVIAVVGPILLSNSLIRSVAVPRILTHFLSLLLFIGIVLFFFLPLLVWKYIGQQRANALTRRWAVEDARGSRYNGYVPAWAITLPGIITNSTRLTVRLPVGSSPTSAYDPSAYIPSWVNGRRDSNPFADQNPGSFDALPLYNDRGAPLHSDEKAPAYV